MSRPNDLVEVYSPQNVAEVAILEGLLQDAGIATFVVNDQMQGVLGEVPYLLSRPRIWLQTDDAERARTICLEFDRRQAAVARGAAVNDTPFCFHCGETVTEGDAHCPKCAGAL